MASHDVMPDVQLYQPAELDDALNLLDRHGDEGWLLGGGQDTYGWLKDRAKQPKAMIDLNGIEELHGIRDYEPPETHVAWREEVAVVTDDRADSQSVGIRGRVAG